MSEHVDVVIVGGGHNGLTAAAYLARMGRSVTVLEQADHVGGAAVSATAFPGVDIRLSRYSYLVSLMPDLIRAELGLRVELANRAIASFTPVTRKGTATGLLVERTPGARTRESFRSVTGSDRDFDAWCRFYAQMAQIAAVVAPSLLEPLVSKATMMQRLRDSGVGGHALTDAFEVPIGETLERDFNDDDVRGIIATDAVVGAFVDLHDPSLLQNRYLLYHLMGNGTGEWRAPVGGMGRVTDELHRVARQAGAAVRTSATVTRVDADGRHGQVRWRDAEGGSHVIDCDWVLSNAAPWTLDHLRGVTPGPRPEGAQVKVNLALHRLPRLASGVDPADAFCGTLHIDESMASLTSAHAAASRGELPSPAPCEIYCHTLTDPSILGDGPRAAGWHTMTLFGVHTPARLFAGEDRDGVAIGQEMLQRYLSGINSFLAEPFEDCLALDRDGRPCVEVATTVDIEGSVGLPGGHIYHRDVRWPWAGSDIADSSATVAPDTAADADSVEGAWGVETDVANLLICGAGARRGGGVSGIPGRNAAMRVRAASGAA